MEKYKIIEKIRAEHPVLDSVDTVNHMIVFYYLDKLESIGLIQQGGFRITEKALAMLAPVIDSGWQLDRAEVSEVMSVLFEMNGQEDTDLDKIGTSTMQALVELVLRMQEIGPAKMRMEVQNMKNEKDGQAS